MGGAVDSGEAAPPTRVLWVLGSFGDALHTYNPDLVKIRFTDSTLSDDQWRQVEEAEAVILATQNARESQHQRDLGKEVARRADSPLITIATCNPYDFLEDPEMRTYLAAYEPTVEAFRAGVDIVYGEASAGVKLPIAASRG